jgi:uncharacterized membrane protein
MQTNTGSVQKKPPGGTTLKKLAWPHYLIVALTLAAAVATLFNPPGTTSNLDALLLLLATAGSISALARTLPLQSVLFAAFITALIGGTAHGLSAHTGLPFGPLSFGAASGPQLFNTVPMTVPMLWVVAIFNSRGVARLMLRPWRRVKNYGFRLIALTAALALAFDLALEPFARAKHLWLWQPTKIPLTWFGASPLSLLGWVCVSLLILAIIMPYLIRKQPGQSSGPDYAPLALWLGAMVVFAVNPAQAGQWAAVIMDGLAAVAVLVFSWRGAKW